MLEVQSMHRMIGTLQRWHTLYFPLCFKGTFTASWVIVWRNVGQNCWVVTSVVNGGDPTVMNSIKTSCFCFVKLYFILANVQKVALIILSRLLVTGSYCSACWRCKDSCTPPLIITTKKKKKIARLVWWCLKGGKKKKLEMFIFKCKDEENVMRCL